MTTNTDQLVGQHYDRENLGERILAGLTEEGKDPDQLTLDDLVPVDQIHTGGRAATRELMRMADLPRGAAVVDVGGGLGGPARALAAELGCRVTVLDLSQAFCDAGAMLTERTGLGDLVTFRYGSATAMPFGDGAFDAAWSQHSSMNIEDKVRLYSEIHRVLRPGGRFALHEIFAGAVQPLHYPVPWASGPEISFLRPAAEIRGQIQATGFRELAWVDVTAKATDWWRTRMVASATQQGPQRRSSLLNSSEFATIVASLMRNLEEGRIAVIQAIFERA